jgi:undecaprenyl diphosphate synthase
MREIAVSPMQGVPQAFDRQPRHVAIIMDGNGRWAHERSLPRSAGHRQGVAAVRRAVRAALELGIDYLTIYSFSAENWSRPAEEVSDLLGLLKRFIQQDVAELHGAGVKVRIIGERANLSSDIAPLIEQTERLTRDNTRLTLIVAFNYGSRQEIARAARSLAEEVKAGRLAPDEITPEAIARSLYASDVPDPDLLIRTGGEQRLSNFLLWQCAYSEFVFVPEHWPDFSREILERALTEYRTRDRRFGGLSVRAL